MIDTDSRRNAAELIERFRDGEISNFEFADSWPRYDGRDRALKAVETMLWRSYSDLDEHTLAEEGHELTSEVRDIFDRCILFLRSDLEYQWPEDNFIGIRGLGSFGRIFTLGLSVFLDRARERREKRRLVALRVVGENAVWPFFETEEYTLQRCRDIGHGSQSG